MLQLTSRLEACPPPAVPVASASGNKRPTSMLQVHGGYATSAGCRCYEPSPVQQGSGRARCDTTMGLFTNDGSGSSTRDAHAQSYTRATGAPCRKMRVELSWRPICSTRDAWRGVIVLVVVDVMRDCGLPWRIFAGTVGRKSSLQGDDVDHFNQTASATLIVRPATRGIARPNPPGDAQRRPLERHRTNSFLLAGGRCCNLEQN